MESVHGRLASGTTNILVLLAQIVPILGIVKGLSGGTVSADQKSALVGFVLSTLDTIEGISGKAIAADVDVQAAASTLIDAFGAFHDLITKKHLAAPPPA